MPKYAGKQYAYTPAGIKAANAAKKRDDKKQQKRTRPKRK